MISGFPTTQHPRDAACPDFLYAGRREGHVCGFH
jgi:hypothetical protein